MKYSIGYERNSIVQSIIIDGPDADTCIAYFQECKPDATVYGASIADSVKPGQPVRTVPDGWKPAQEAQEAQEATESESVQEAQEKPTQEAQEATETEIAKTYVNLISTQILTRKARSAWERGVKAYAEELIEELREAAEGGYIDASDLTSKAMTQKALLNGAPSWEEYSWGGCSLIYDSQIANRLCAPWELRKTRNGEKKPNAREEWLDTQARALRQAAGLIEIARLAVMQEVM